MDYALVYQRSSYFSDASAKLVNAFDATATSQLTNAVASKGILSGCLQWQSIHGEGATVFDGELCRAFLLTVGVAIGTGSLGEGTLILAISPIGRPLFMNVSGSDLAMSTAGITSAFGYNSTQRPPVRRAFEFVVRL